MKEHTTMNKSKTYIQLYMASYVFMVGIIVLFLALATHLDGIEMEDGLPDLFPTVSLALSLYMIVTLVLSLLFWDGNRKTLSWSVALCVFNGFNSFIVAVARDSVSFGKASLIMFFGPQPTLFQYGVMGLELNFPTIILLPLWLVMIVWGLILYSKKTDKIETEEEYEA